jgi:hypothetical protein
MQFVAGVILTSTLKRLASAKGAKKIAIAYWGANALELLKLRTQRKNVRIICCLKGGKSDPDIIKKFGKRAKQHDQLHAKVLWTPSGAVVGSANASSNGLPEEEEQSAGLIEAGIFVDDPEHLKHIESWFDTQFAKSRIVKRADLQAAKLARATRIWGKSSSSSHKTSFVDALKEGKREFSKQRIYFAIYKSALTDSEIREAEKSRKQNATKMQRKLVIKRDVLNLLDYYGDWSDLPKNAILIDVYYRRKKIRIRGPFKTFPVSATWDGFTYVLPRKHSGFAYTLTERDKRVIRRAPPQLWAKTRGSADGRVINLFDAAPVLLDQTR